MFLSLHLCKLDSFRLFLFRHFFVCLVVAVDRHSFNKDSMFVQKLANEGTISDLISFQKHSLFFESASSVKVLSSSFSNGAKVTAQFETSGREREKNWCDLEISPSAGSFFFFSSTSKLTK